MVENPTRIGTRHLLKRKNIKIWCFTQHDKKNENIIIVNHDAWQNLQIGYINDCINLNIENKQ